MVKDLGPFSYELAFARNVGWVTEQEQARLKQCSVAIGGLGGVGGAHAITLARLGVGNFRLADFDVFDWPNMNRQAGAFASTIGQPKIDAMARQLRDINPEVGLHLMPQGLGPENIGEFLDGADLYMDGLDVFALGVRRLVFARCRELRIPAVTAAPMGMGTSLLAFHPDGMSFEEYFCFDGLGFEDQMIKFIVGVSPSMQQRQPGGTLLALGAGMKERTHVGMLPFQCGIGPFVQAHPHRQRPWGCPWCMRNPLHASICGLGSGKKRIGGCSASCQTRI